MSSNIWYISDYFKQAIIYIPIIKSVFMYMASSYYILPNLKQNKFSNIQSCLHNKGRRVKLVK